ncbi:TRAP transporter small permease [Desulfotomaculum sp. 1211_IL3151]|uniref:TRAP transporter small permease n=1 Tax=Desulfotomaculum sp. 1211_IL3151 TaxID=3084055 RepID=UPI002FDB79CE
MSHRTFNDWLKLSWDGLLKIQKGIMVFTSLSIIVAISLGAILRYVFKTDIKGLEEILVVLAFWMYFMGGSYGSYEKSHITAEIISTMVKKPQILGPLKLFSSFMTTALCLVVTYFAANFFLWSLAKGGTTTALKIPLIISQSSIFIGFVLMSLYTVIHFIKDLAAYRKGEIA